jgi:hypothetical protein
MQYVTFAVVLLGIILIAGLFYVAHRIEVICVRIESRLDRMQDSARRHQAG